MMPAINFLTAFRYPYAVLHLSKKATSEVGNLFLGSRPLAMSHFNSAVSQLVRKEPKQRQVHHTPIVTLTGSDAYRFFVRRYVVSTDIGDRSRSTGCRST